VVSKVSAAAFTSSDTVELYVTFEQSTSMNNWHSRAFVFQRISRRHLHVPLVSVVAAVVVDTTVVPFPAIP